MTKIDKHIEIARTSKGKFSSMGAKACARIASILSLQYERVGVSIVDDIYGLNELVDKKPDLVFLGLKRLPNNAEYFDELSDDVWISEYLDQNGINYTGAAASAMKLDFNKEKAKAHVRFANLPTAPSFVAKPGKYSPVASLPLPFPLFIKPLNGGGSRGVGADSVARNYNEYTKKVESVHSVNGSSSLVEQYLDGREFSVAILDTCGSSGQMAMPVEIITTGNARGDRILGSTVKSEDNELVVTIDDMETRSAVSELATHVYKVLGGRDIGRIDIRMDSAGKAYFLEANFMPAPGTRYFAGAFRDNSSLLYEEILFEITEHAFYRYDNRSINIPIFERTPNTFRGSKRIQVFAG